MKTKTDSNPVRPRDIYTLYPDSDLLGAPVPHVRERLDTYFKRAGKDFGDTLFLFLLNECCEEEEISFDEILRRLDRAVEDIQAIRDGLLKRYERYVSGDQS